MYTIYLERGHWLLYRAHDLLKAMDRLIKLCARSSKSREQNNKSCLQFLVFLLACHVHEPRKHIALHQIHKTMIRPSPYCDDLSRRDETKTIKPNRNEAFVASSGDIITDYNDLYCLFTRCVALRCVNMTISVFVIRETQQALLYAAQNSCFTRQSQKRI